MTKFILQKCPDCHGIGQVPYYEETTGRELGTCPCPTCKHSWKPGYVLQRIKEEEPIVIDSNGVRHYRND